MDYSKNEVKRLVSIIINNSITDNITDNINMNDLFIIDRSNDEISTITLNSVIVNRITNQISLACEENLRFLEERNFNKLDNFNINEDYFSFPISRAFNSTIFGDYGPKIPIKLKLIGNVTSGINTDVKDYGINNSIVTISVEIKVELMVILPITTENISITNYIPLSIKMIQGKVPNYYSR